MIPYKLNYNCSYHIHYSYLNLQYSCQNKSHNNSPCMNHYMKKGR